MKKLTIFIVAIGMLFAAGCNRDSSSNNVASGMSESSAGKKLKVVYIPKNTGNPFFTEVNNGFLEAAKELGCEFTTSAPATGDATSQIPIIQDQVQRGVDVIAISANSPDALNAALDDARSHGVTIITVDADLTKNETHRDAAVLPADFNLIGSEQVELLGSLIGYEGEFAILSATADAPNQNAWIAKMKETLAQSKYSKMKLVDTVYGDDEPQKSTTECEALLSKHPGLRGIISPTSVGLAASAQVVDRAGVYPGGSHATGKGLQLTGLSTPNQLKKFVENGSVTAFQLWAPANEGYIALYLGQAIHDKKLTPVAGGEFSTPKFGKLKFSGKLELIAGPLVKFDKSNISKFNF